MTIEDDIEQRMIKRVRVRRDNDPFNPREESDYYLATMCCGHRRYNLGDVQIKGDLYQFMTATAEGLIESRFGPPHKHFPDVFELFGLGLIDAEVVEACYVNVCESLEYCDDLDEDEVEKLISLGAFDQYGALLPKAIELFEDDANEPFYDPDGDMLTEVVSGLFRSLAVYQPLYLYDHSGITISTGRFPCPWDSGQVGFAYIDKIKAEKIAGRSFTDEEYAEIIDREVEEYDNYLIGEVYSVYLEQLDPMNLANDEKPEDSKYWEEVGCAHGFSGYDHKKSGLLDFVKDFGPEWVEAFEQRDYLHG